MMDMHRPMRYEGRPVRAMQWQPGDVTAAGPLIGWMWAVGLQPSHPCGTGETTSLKLTGDEARLTGQAEGGPGSWVVQHDDGRFEVIEEPEFTRRYQSHAGVTHSGE